MSPIEAAARAVANMPRIIERFNDWTSDHVPGLPIEICQDVLDEDGVPYACKVIARYPGMREGDGQSHLARHISEATVRAVLQAIREPSAAMMSEGGKAGDWTDRLPWGEWDEPATDVWQAMIDAAIAEGPTGED